MNRAAEDCADKYPQDSREVSKLSGKNWADKGACAGYRREVVPEQNIPVCGVIIFPVSKRMGGRGAISIEYEDFGDDELRVVPVRYGEQKQSYNYQG
jgi:hypothetical protein